MLDETPTRVASYAYLPEAERAAAALSAVMVPVSVVSRGAGGQSAPGGPSKLERTMMPGWSALEDDLNAPAGSSTMVGLPSRLSEIARAEAMAAESAPAGRGLFDEGDLGAWEALANAAVGVQSPEEAPAQPPPIRGEVVTVRPVSVRVSGGDDRASIPGIRGLTETAPNAAAVGPAAALDPRTASSSNAVVIPASAVTSGPDADADAPGNSGAGWSDILGAALSARLVDEVPGVSVNSSLGAPREHAAEAPRSDVSPQEDPAEMATFILGGGVGLSAAMAPTPAARVNAVPGTRSAAPSATSSGSGSAWEFAGVDLKNAVLARADDDGPAPAPPRARSEQRSDDFGVADGPSRLDVDSLADRAAQSGFARLRPVETDAGDAGVSTRAALLWGVVAPGGGQAYLGSWQRGVTYALSSPLIVPWIVGVREAVREAAAGREGARLVDRRPRMGSAAWYTLAFWASIALVVTVIVSALRFEPRLEAPAPAPEAAAVVVADEAETTEPEASEQADADELSDEERAARLNTVLLDARRACQTERYFLCRELAEEALALDGRSREAQLLHVRAISEGVVEPPPQDPPQPTGYDRQPNRTLAPR